MHEFVEMIFLFLSATKSVKLDLKLDLKLLNRFVLCEAVYQAEFLNYESFHPYFFSLQTK